MENRVDILNEIQTLSPLIAGLDKVNVFTVPQGYFNSIAATVLACINEAENNLSSSIGKENSYQVPDTYFDTLASSIIDKIKLQESISDELKILSPALAAINKENVYEVPQGYFKNLPQNIINSLQPAAAKVVYLQRRHSFMKYAAAAMITGAIALGVYQYADRPADNTVIASTETAKADPIVKLDPSIEKGKGMDEKQFNESLSNLSEEDITQYLEKNGDDADVAALSLNVEGASLPSQDDYLLNEKTLQNYLKDIETNKQNN